MSKHFLSQSKSAESASSRAAAAHGVQTKLKVGSPGDRFENEADKAAQKVTSDKSTDPQKTASGTPVVDKVSRVDQGFGKKEEEKKVQKQANEEEQAQAKLQRKEDEKEDDKPVQKQANEEDQAQAKLQRKEDEKEDDKPVQKQANEEEQAQAKLQRKEDEKEDDKPVQKQAKEDEPAQAKLQRKEDEKEDDKPVQKQAKEDEPAQAKVQRKEDEKEDDKPVQKQANEEEQAQAKLQRKEDEKEDDKPVQKQANEEEQAQAKVEPRANIRDKQEYPVLNSVEPLLLRSRGRGEPMSDTLRQEMQTKFGADFSKVRLHTHADAVTMSKEMNAQAFTSGSDIFFDAGRFDPESMVGKILLAHELTHVIQQGEAEQKLSAEKIAENNANVNVPGPQPPDKEAQAIEKDVEQQKKATAELEGEKPDEVKVSLFDDKDLKAVPDAGKKAGNPKRSGGKKSKAGEKAEGEAALSPIAQFLKDTSEAKVKSKLARLKKLGKNEKTKDDASTKLAQTEQAVVPPAQEGEAKANTSQVETVDKTEAPKPDQDKTRQEFQQAMNNAVPSNLEDMTRFKEEGRGKVVGEQVRGVVTAETQEVQTTYKEIENTPDPEPAEVPEELPPTEAAPATPAINPGADVIGEVQPEHTDMSEFENSSDNQLKEEQIDEENLKMVDKGPLAEANTERQTLKDQVQSAPEEVKVVEQEQKQKVQDEMKVEEQEGRREMRVERLKKLENTKKKQKGTKKTLEEKRKAVTDHINQIYESTNTTVQKKLSDLETQSLKAFDDGQAQATKTFEDNVKRRIDAFKDDRYSGMFGWARWLKDKWLGMEDLPAVKAIFDSERSTFVSSIDQQIATITAENKRVIQECKDMVQQARDAIAKYVAGLGPELRSVGQEAQKDMQSKLNALDETVNKKEEELKQKLEAKREEAIKAIDEKIEKMKEAMSGLLAKLAGLLLDAMVKFFKWALEKVGYDPGKLMEIINKGKAVIKAIVTDPIGFIGNIIKAVKTGINNFQDNIKKHLISGLMSWLTGAMNDLPIQFPKTFDLKGIIDLILQVMGLTWPQIRLVLVERLGEKTVAAAEETVDIVKRVITEGPIAMWELIKEKAEEIKEHVMEGVRNWAAFELVKQGVIKLLSMLNPVGAIVQAILAIYNTVMFFVENWQRIVDFVGSIFSSIGNIAKGAISAAAAAIERALALTIPIILGFLARFIGLSGVGKAVKNIIMRLRKPIDKVVHKMADMVGKLVKKVVGKGKALAKKGKEKVKAGVEKVLAWWKIKTDFKTSTGESHKVFFKKKGNTAELKIASNEEAVKKFIDDVKGKVPNENKELVVKAENAYKDVMTTKASIEQEKDAVKKQKTFESLRSKTNILATSVMPLFEFETVKKVPETILPPMMDNVKAHSIDAKFISQKTPKGKTADYHKGNLQGWKELQDGGVRAKENWVKMHLLHHNLGGLATDSNLTPGKSSLNQRFYKEMEKPTLEIIAGTREVKDGKGKIVPVNQRAVWYSAVISYHTNTNQFINSISAGMGLHKHDQNWAPGRALFNWSTSVEAPNLQGVAISINEAGFKILSKFDMEGEKLTQEFIKLLISERNKSKESNYSKFKSYDGLANLFLRLKNAYPNSESLIKTNVAIVTKAYKKGILKFAI